MGEDYNAGAKAAKNCAEARNRARDLLWENIEASSWWLLCEDSTLNADLRKQEIQYNQLQNTFTSFFTSFSLSISLIDDQEVHKILQYGAARRISSMRHAAKSFSDIISPDREHPLSQEESRIVSDALLLLYVHMIGVLDAFAIALYRISGDGAGGTERQADLLNKKFRKNVAFDELEGLFMENDGWFERVKNALRNRFVHRVPPYVPPSAMTPAEVSRHQELDALIWQKIKLEEFELVDQYREEQKSLGRFFPIISFIDCDHNMPLISTVTDDLIRFQYITLTIFENLTLRLRFR